MLSRIWVGAGRVPLVALHATTIRFADRAYLAIARAADSQGISVSQYVREAALIRAVLDELDSAEEALHTADDLLAIARRGRMDQVANHSKERSEDCGDAADQECPPVGATCRLHSHPAPPICYCGICLCCFMT